jgi:hypothetical protein
MSVRPHRYGEWVDSLVPVVLYGYLFCALACLLRLFSQLRLFSHLLDYLSAQQLREAYFIECLLLLPLVIRYRVWGSAIVLTATAIIFNPIHPIRLGSWILWQIINFIGLVLIGFGGMLIQDKRKNLMTVSNLE